MTLEYLLQMIDGDTGGEGEGESHFKKNQNPGCG